MTQGKQARLHEIERGILAGAAHEQLEREQQAARAPQAANEQHKQARMNEHMAQAVTTLRNALPLLAERDKWLKHGRGDVHELKRICDEINHAEQRAGASCELYRREAGHMSNQIALAQAMSAAHWPDKGALRADAQPFAKVLYRALVFGHLNEAGVTVAQSHVNLAY
jgi:hypothetical protein